RIAIVKPALTAIAIVLLCGGAVAVAASFARRVRTAVAAIVATAALALVAATWARLEAEPLRSYAALSRKIERVFPGIPVISYHRYVQGLPFYCQRRVILVGPPSELRFGMERAPDRNEFFLASDKELLDLWN